MQCPSCKSDNPDGALYCGMCKEVFRRDSAENQELERPEAKAYFVGSYQMIRRLGGSFGVAYLAFLPEAERHLALKIFRELDANARAELRRDLQAWVDLERHPHLVRAHFAEEFQSQVCIAMEYVDGGSLESVLERRQPQLDEALRWTIEICHGMEHANARGVAAHRDLKPANVLLDANRARIADFGLAPSRGKQTGHSGTPAYMAPEQWAGHADARSDIYAAGVMLYRLLSRTLPFAPPTASDPRASLSELQRLHAQAPPPPLETAAWPILERCLAKRRDHRYESFAELRADAEALLLREHGERVPAPAKSDLQMGAIDLCHTGQSLAALERFDDAVACFDRALRIDPLSAAAWQEKGDVLQQLGRHAEAIEFFDGALGVDPQHAGALRKKARSLLEVAKLQEAKSGR